MTVIHAFRFAPVDDNTGIFYVFEMRIRNE